jgi:hypothetical protein
MNSEQSRLLIVDQLREQIRGTANLQPHPTTSRLRRLQGGTTAAIVALACVGTAVAIAVAVASLSPGESFAQTVIRHTVAAQPDQGIIYGRARELAATHAGTKTMLTMEWWVEHAPDGTERIHELDRDVTGRLKREFALTIRQGRSRGALYLGVINALLPLSQPYPARAAQTAAVTGMLTPGALRQLLDRPGTTVKRGLYEGNNAYTITSQDGAHYIVDAHTYQIRALIPFRSGPIFELTIPHQLAITPANEALLQMSPHPGAQHPTK